MSNATQPPRRMRFSFESRCRLVSLVLAGHSPQAAAAACGASRATGYRLWRRYLEGGWGALRDRPPVPKHQPRRLPRELEQRILAAREYAKAGPLIVASQLGLPASTVWKVLRRYGVSRLRRPVRGPVVRLRARAPGRARARRHQAPRPLPHRGQGDPEGRHRTLASRGLAVPASGDRRPRLAYAELLPSESPADCAAFLRRALGWYCERGITIERVLSDNGNGYRSHAWAAACAELQIARRYTRPRRPQTQRQGGSAREDAPTRVGIPLRLPHERSSRPSAPRLPALVQPAPTAQLTRRPTADQPRLTGLWVPHLGRLTAFGV